MFFIDESSAFSSFIEDLALKIAPDSTTSLDITTSPLTSPVDRIDNKSFTRIVPFIAPSISAEVHTTVPSTSPFLPITTFPFVSIDPSKLPSTLKSHSDLNSPLKELSFSRIQQLAELL